MKTFDEAFDVIVKETDLLGPNLEGMKDEQLANAKFVKTVIAIGNQWAKETMHLEVREFQVATLATFHVLINLVIRIGQEMEKNDV